MKNGYDRDKNEWASEDHADVIKKGTVIRVRLLAVTMQHDTIVRQRKLKSRTVCILPHFRVAFNRKFVCVPFLGYSVALQP
jgi:hypothetical protein